MLIFGHRGAAGTELENTAASFIKAFELGADGIECDLRLNADGKLVVFHDDDLKRLAGSTRQIRSLKTSDIGGIKLQKKIGGGIKTGAIASPEDAAAAAGKNGWINFELKPQNDEHRLAAEAIKMIERLGLADRTIISSFSGAALAEAKKIGPTIKRGLLIEDWIEQVVDAAQALAAWSVHPHFSAINAGRRRMLSAAGLKVFVYTANRRSTIARLTRIGVDGIITDFPHRAKALLDAGKF